MWQWALQKPLIKFLKEQFVLEESDRLRSEGGLFLLINYCKFCSQEMKGKIISNLVILSQWND